MDVYLELAAEQISLIGEYLKTEGRLDLDFIDLHVQMVQDYLSLARAEGEQSIRFSVKPFTSSVAAIRAA